MIQQPGNTNLEQEPVTGKYREAFSTIFGAIEDYHIVLGYPPNPEHSELTSIVERHRQFTLAIMAETTELLEALPWKPWRPDLYKELDIVNAAEESDDIIFFLGSVRENLGITTDEMADIFERKLIENKRRILIGYNKASTDME